MLIQVEYRTQHAKCNKIQLFSYEYTVGRTFAE